VTGSGTGDPGQARGTGFVSDVRDAAHPAALAVLGLACVASVVGWFLVRSPMWLDEALSVNISKLPLSQIPHALRHDGHPPLYYVLLHFWMDAVGSGTHAIRALSGIFALLTIPLAWHAGKRLGGTRLAFLTALVFTVSPFALRYASEARMYSLIMLEVFAGYLLVSASLERATPIRLIGIAVVTGALLWTQYWSMWLIAAVGMLLIARLVIVQRSSANSLSPNEVRAAYGATLATIGAVVVGGLLFIPWVPTLLFQARHTGTPWAPAFKPTTMVVTSFMEFAGGPYSEPQLFMLVLIVLLVVGATGRAIGPRTIELDLLTRPGARRPLYALVGTIVIACIAGVASGSGFAPRYASVFFPIFVLLVALGLDAVPTGAARNIVLVVFAAMAVVSIGVVFRLDRSQSRVVADRIRATAPAAFVITCPDQLGPSLSRELTGKGYDIRSYPGLGGPDFVDWVDYAQRNKRNDPNAVAARALLLAGPRPIFLVYRDDFLTLTGQCSRLLGAMAGHRAAQTLVNANKDFYEPMSLVELPPPTHS